MVQDRPLLEAVSLSALVTQQCSSQVENLLRDLQMDPSHVCVCLCVCVCVCVFVYVTVCYLQETVPLLHPADTHRAL